jgi:hypothetical protein
MVVHGFEIEDRPGALYELLASIAAEEVDLHCLMAYSAGDGSGMVYLGAKDPAALQAWATDTGTHAEEATGFAIEGDDKVGAAATALKGLADAGINGIVGAAMVCDGGFHMGVVVAAEDGDEAEKVLE